MPGMGLEMDALTGPAIPDDYPRLLTLDVESILEFSFQHRKRRRDICRGMHPFMKARPDSDRCQRRWPASNPPPHPNRVALRRSFLKNTGLNGPPMPSTDSASLHRTLVLGLGRAHRVGRCGALRVIDRQERASSALSRSALFTCTPDFLQAAAGEARTEKDNPAA